MNQQQRAELIRNSLGKVELGQLEPGDWAEDVQTPDRLHWHARPGYSSRFELDLRLGARRSEVCDRAGRAAVSSEVDPSHSTQLSRTSVA